MSNAPSPPATPVAPRPLTAAEVRRMQRYVRRVADLLGLRDWHITVCDYPCDDDAVAMTTPTHGQRRAEIAFSTRFVNLTPEEQRATVAHELLHCHLVNTDHVIERDLRESGALSASAHALILAAYNRQREYAVDAIAEAIAGYLPELTL